MLDRMHLRFNFFLAPLRLHREGALSDDPASVHRRVDIMDRHAHHLNAVFNRLPDRVLAFKRRQERGMDIHNPLIIRFQHHRRQQPHIPRQRDPLHTVSLAAGDDLTFVIRLGRIVLRIKRKHVNAALLRLFNDRCAWLIDDDQRDFRVQLTGFDRVGDRFKVRAGAGSEDGDALH